MTFGISSAGYSSMSKSKKMKNDGRSKNKKTTKTNELRV